MPERQVGAKSQMHSVEAEEFGPYLSGKGERGRPGPAEQAR